MDVLRCVVDDRAQDSNLWVCNGVLWMTELRTPICGCVKSVVDDRAQDSNLWVCSGVLWMTELRSAIH